MMLSLSFAGEKIKVADVFMKRNSIESHTGISVNKSVVHQGTAIQLTKSANKSRFNIKTLLIFGRKFAGAAWLTEGYY